LPRTSYKSQAKNTSINIAAKTCNKCCLSDVIILTRTKGGMEIKTQKNAITGKEIHENTYRKHENLVMSMTGEWWQSFEIPIRMIRVRMTSLSKYLLAIEHTDVIRMQEIFT
jgi:hypothetical protein